MFAANISHSLIVFRIGNILVFETNEAVLCRCLLIVKLYNHTKQF
jgi:hypothetical protein